MSTTTTEQQDRLFYTIREIAKQNILPEHCLRKMLKAGKLPGFHAGTRFYVNRGLLLELIEHNEL